MKWMRKNYRTFNKGDEKKGIQMVTKLKYYVINFKYWWWNKEKLLAIIFTKKY